MVSRRAFVLDFIINTECSGGVHCDRNRFVFMLSRFVIPALLLMALVMPASAQPGILSDRQRGRDGFPASQWDQPREERGPQREVPLSLVLREIRARFGGEHLDAQRLGDRYIISWITDDGRRLTIEVDATSGRILSTR